MDRFLAIQAQCLAADQKAMRSLGRVGKKTKKAAVNAVRSLN